MNKYIENNILLFVCYILRCRKWITALLAAVCLLAVGYAAQAQVSFVTQTANLRQGPGIKYARIAALTRGIMVHRYSCHSGWCQINSHLGRGWVSIRYLSRFSHQPKYEPGYRSERPRDYQRPDVSKRWNPLWGVGPAFPPRGVR